MRRVQFGPMPAGSAVAALVAGLGATLLASLALPGNPIGPVQPATVPAAHPSALPATPASASPANSSASPSPAVATPGDWGDPYRGCTLNRAMPKRQFRAMWIASVLNIDWPSRRGLEPSRQRAEFIRHLERAKKFGLNAVVVQVRPAADAFWPSKYEPWSAYLSGSQGRSPGYDPMAFMVAEAHKRNLEFHAWYNPYRAALQADRERLAASHPARRHPDWTVVHDGKIYYNPGLPHVRRFVEDAVLDSVRRYDVDGVHFDDYFYPYPGSKNVRFDDAATYRRYGKGFRDLAAWRRNNINLLVQETSARVHALKPWVRFGISPFGIWRNRSTDPAGSDTRGLQAYDVLHADTRTWVRKGWVDYIVPQLYWPLGFAPADYAKLTDWWSRQVAGTRVRLYVGQALYRVGEPGAWSDGAELTRHLAVNRRHPGVSGDVFYSAKYVLSDPRSAMQRVSSTHYLRPALTPAMVPAAGAPPVPAAPGSPAVTRAERGTRLRWRPSERAVGYVVYRFGGDQRPEPCAFADASHLVGVVGAEPTWVDATADPARSYGYAITALDRYGREGEPSTVTAVSSAEAGAAAAPTDGTRAARMG